MKQDKEHEGVSVPFDAPSPSSNPQQDPLRPTPSQAEGDRATVEEDLGEESEQQARSDQYPKATPRTPSQAEGDRETVEEDLRRQQ